MKQRGSALIIAMMLIATVGAAAFGIARLLYVDTSISTTYENGSIAYYAAESGIEEGFLRYKYNMNAEVPIISWNMNIANVFRTNLARDKVYWGPSGDFTGEPQSDDLDKNYSPGNYWSNAVQQQIYDIRMGYLGTYDGNLAGSTNVYDPKFYHQMDNDNGIDIRDIFDPNFSTGDFSFLRVPRDESKKFDLSNLDLSASGNIVLNLGFRFVGVKNGAATFTVANECNAMAEVKFSITTPGGLTKEYKALTSYNPTDCASPTGIEAGKLDAADSGFSTGGWNELSGNTGIHDPNAATDIGYYYKFSNILNKVLTKAGANPPLYYGDNDNRNSKITMSVKPLYYSADVFFATNTAAGFGCDRSGGTTCKSTKSQVVTGPYSYINATGYYGGVSRSISANIDRQSGTLYDLYDYVLFKGN